MAYRIQCSHISVHLCFRGIGVSIILIGFDAWNGTAMYKHPKQKAKFCIGLKWNDIEGRQGSPLEVSSLNCY